MRIDTGKIGHQALRSAIPAGAGLLGFLVMAILYCAADHGTYNAILAGWGINPFPFPFLVTDTVLSALRCKRIGVDVYQINPCDALGRVYDYSPLWLSAWVFPVTKAWILPVGSAIDGSFLLSLLLLPNGRGWRETALMTTGVLSTAVAFAMERGNNDLLIFVLAACAASLATYNAGFRRCGYSLALLAGLLKYYPMTMLLLATRERWKMFAAVTAAASCILLLFVTVEWHDLGRALSLIPTGSYFGDMFGASTLSGGLAANFGWPAKSAILLELLFAIAALMVGVAVGLSRPMRLGISFLSDQERSFLLVGAALLLGCFFTAQNIGYRAIHLLFLLPALTALGRFSDRRDWNVGIRVSTFAVLGLLWSEGLRRWTSQIVADFDLVNGLHVQFTMWLLRELCWWWTMTMLIGVLCALVRQSKLALSLPSRRN